MRARAVFALAAALLLEACGYVGPVLPPSPQIPLTITDLTAVERGTNLVVTFSVPLRTLDNLPVERFSAIDLRVAPSSTPFDFSSWLSTASAVEVTPPPEYQEGQAPVATLSKVIPINGLIGKQVSLAVRTAGARQKNYSGWSNVVTLPVLTPLASPDIKTQATAGGVLLTWTPVTDATEYRIYRESATTPAAQLGASTTPDYLDTSAQYDVEYKYTAVAVHGARESLASEPATIMPVDTFAPSVPASITALSAPGSIEVTWQRSPETDLNGYFLFRSVDGGPLERVGDLLPVPSYSDRNVQHGKTYRYAVSAVDTKNNVSAKSAFADVSF